MKMVKTMVQQQKTQRWAVILAGGRGTRLQSLTRKLYGEGPSGEAKPKQFCSLFGGATLLGHTRSRIGTVIPEDRTAFVVVKSHAHYYEQELGGVDPGRILAQPHDRGTTAAIAFALARIAAIEPEAVAGFYPADHYFADEAAFSRAMEQAYGLAAVHSDSLLLLGAQPEHPEVEYGWIEPGPALEDGKSVFRVSRFWEKPTQEVAQGLLQRGCLWNTFVMVGRVRTFLDALRETTPAVFRAIEPVIDSRCSDAAVNNIYKGLPTGDFSKQVLSALPDRLAVLRLDNVGWSDLGTPERVVAMWERSGAPPLIDRTVEATASCSY